MIQLRTVLTVADNSGAKKAIMIGMPFKGNRKYAYIGEIVNIAVKEAIPFGQVKKGEVLFKQDRVAYWMSKGAQISDTVHNFLVSQKLIEGKKRNVLSKKSPTKAKKELKKA